MARNSDKSEAATGEPTAPVAAVSNEVESPARAALVASLKPHVDTVWTRAKQERATRESKWCENLLIADGQVFSAGASQKAKSPGEWRAGDDGNQTERLRIARQKCVAAKVALGDSFFKSERVPFGLAWAVGVSETPETLEKIRARTDEICFVGGMPQRMRVEIEDAASYGEGWIHGMVAADPAGRPVGAIEAVSPWEMFFDEAGGEDLNDAEYVIRERWLSPFEVSRVVKGAEAVYDQAAVLRAMSMAKTGGRTADNPKNAETRTRTEMIQWREFWLHVPAALVKVDGGPALLGKANLPNTATLDWVPVLVVMAGDEMVGVKVKPGVLPYFRAVWDIERTRALPQGVYDVMGPTQEVMTGVVRAWLSNIRKASQIILAGRRDKIRQDPEKLADGMTFIDLDPDCRDVREAIQQFTVNGNSDGLIQAIEMLLQFSDMESCIPRAQQGLQSAAEDPTAYHLRARLLSSGKYLGEIARRQDGAIRWSVGWTVYVMALVGEIPHEGQLQIVPLGFAQFTDLVTRLDGLLQMLGLGGQNPRIDALLNHEGITRQLVKANDLDARETLLSAEQQQQRAQAEASSQQTQLALANAQADIAVKQAKAARDNAAAAAAAGNAQLGRAKFIHDVEQAGAGAGAGGPPNAQPQPATKGAANEP